jgi:hypothetical protein
MDAGNAALLGAHELPHADDAFEERRAARVEEEQSFDGVGEVGGEDRFTVRVTETLAQAQCVGAAIARDLRQ